LPSRCFPLQGFSAVLGMRLSDFYEKRRRYWFRFVEKGVKHHKVPFITKPRIAVTGRFLGRSSGRGEGGGGELMYCSFVRSLDVCLRANTPDSDQAYG
jgi:hypothetical protein